MLGTSIHTSLTAECPPRQRVTFLAREFRVMRKHAPTGFGIRQATKPGTHVLLHVRDLVRGGNGAGYCRMGNNELEKELRPVRAIELCRPGGQRLAAHRAEQRAPARRAGGGPSSTARSTRL